MTAKGADVVPILLTMVQFSAKWYADVVFADRTARPLAGIFDEGYIRESLGVTAHQGADLDDTPARHA